MITDKAKIFGVKKNGEKHNFFCILNNYLDGYKPTEQEQKNRKTLGLHDYFELYDDDDIKYYSGYMNLELMHQHDKDEFTILDMAMADSGCVYIKTRNKEGKMEML